SVHRWPCAAGASCRRAGAARLDLSIKNLDVTNLAEGRLDQARGELELKAQHLTLTHDLFAALPAGMGALRDIDRDFEPRGPVSFEFSVRRDSSGGWRRHCVIRPEDLRMEFVKFPYLVEHLSGTIEHDGAADVPDVIKLNLSARAGER